MKQPLRVLIIGGVAGGASAAARLRRLDEKAEITMFERGPYISFANCGLPYQLGGEIDTKEKLVLQTPERFWTNLRVKVCVGHEVTRIDRDARRLEVRELATGTTSFHPYDKVILAMGATPVRPPIPGLERPGLFPLRTIPDLEAIQSWLASHPCRRAVIVGAGFIGLEVAEQLQHRNLQVSIVETAPQVLPPLDIEMASLLHPVLKSHQVDLHLEDGVTALEPDPEAQASAVVLKSGQRLPADLILLGVGVRPKVTLAQEAGLALGPKGGVRVDAYLRTSDHDIFAVGDLIEVKNPLTEEWGPVPLAGPANRQGRIAADNIVGGQMPYRGTLGTAIVRVFERTAAVTGASERTLRRLGRPFQALHLHPNSHAGYYPGAQTLSLKILFDPTNGRLLGAQAVGGEGVDKRIDVLATALHAGMTVEDLAELELAYAPMFGSAKDPINLAGMAAQNILEGKVDVVHWQSLQAPMPPRVVLLDVRSDEECEKGTIPTPHWLHIPLPALRDRLDELDPKSEYWVHCASGQRSYSACRILMQNGYRCRNVSGSYKTWAALGEH